MTQVPLKEKDQTLEELALEMGYIPKEDGSIQGKRDKPLKPFRPNNMYTYQAIKFWNPEMRHYRTVYVHRLVWTMFVSHIPEGALVFHRDNDPTNNQLSNLALSDTEGMVTLSTGERMTVEEYDRRFGVKKTG